MSNSNQQSEFLTVSQLNELIREVLNLGFPRGVWVCGEIQGYNRNRDKRHIFFELSEKDADTQEVVARTSLVIFANRKAHLRETLKEAQDAFELKDDIEVKFFCKVDFYPPHGAVRLIVEGIDPIYTLGKIAQEKQRLIALLKKSGVLDKNKALAVPLVPLNIGLITAFDSAAYNDFLSELSLSGFAFQVHFFKSLMQGKGAPDNVCLGLDVLGARQDLDVIVITRGGGSVSDLSCFDSQVVAEKIAACPLPVLSGIGHEINITVTDLAAHTHQKTPTAIAQLLVQTVEDYLLLVREKTERVLSSAKERIDQQRSTLKDIGLALQDGTRGFFALRSEHLQRLSEAVIRLSAGRLKKDESSLKDREERLLRGVEAYFERVRLRLKRHNDLVKLVHPQQTLRRGFSITRTEEGQLVNSVKGLKEGSGLVTFVKDGALLSDVVKIKKGQKDEGCQIREGR